MSYPVGSRPRITVTFTDASGAVTDPADVTFVYEDPNGAITTLTYAGSTVSKLSTGIYYIDVDTTGLPGRWHFRAYSPAGTTQAATPDLNLTIDGTST